MPYKDALDPLFNLSDEPQIEKCDVVVYLVYKQGHFGHGAHAISMDKKDAISLAKLAAERDHDDHHSYDVYDIPLNKIPDHSGDFMADFGWMNREPVFSIKKSLSL